MTLTTLTISVRPAKKFSGCRMLTASADAGSTRMQARAPNAARWVVITRVKREGNQNFPGFSSHQPAPGTVRPPISRSGRAPAREAVQAHGYDADQAFFAFVNLVRLAFEIEVRRV